MCKRRRLNLLAITLVLAVPACNGAPDDNLTQSSEQELLSVTTDASVSSCCPAGWNMYSCRSEDGRKGLNCHNPRLGCPSSLICGEGCDFGHNQLDPKGA